MFLLAPAHPGCPGQNPESRKTAVCVCVCVRVLNEYNSLEASVMTVANTVL